MTESRIHSVAALLLLAAASSAACWPDPGPRSTRAGTVLRVGTSQPFATIDAALAVAVGGDLVLVDPGSYPSFRIVGFGVSVASALGPSQPFTIVQSQARPAVQIEFVPSGHCASVLHMRTSLTDPTAAAVVIRNCAGAVRLHSCELTAGPDFLQGHAARGAVEVTLSPNVWFGDTVLGAPGGKTFTTQPPLALTPGNAGFAGLWLSASNLVLTHSSIRAWDNPALQGAACWGGDAIVAVGACRLWVTGNVVLAAGSALASGPASYGGSAVHAVSSPPACDLQACDMVALQPGNGSAGKGGYFAIDNDRGQVGPGLSRTAPACIFEDYGITAASTATPSIGTPLSLTVVAMTARAFMTFVGDRQAIGSLPGVAGRTLLDFAQAPIAIAAGNLSAAAPVPVTLPVPNDPALVGLGYAVQSVLAPVQGVSGWALTTGALGVVRP